MKFNNTLIFIVLLNIIGPFENDVTCHPEGSISEKSDNNRLKKRPENSKLLDPDNTEEMDFESVRKKLRVQYISLNMENIRFSDFITRRMISHYLSYNLTPANGKIIKSVFVKKGPLWNKTGESECREVTIYLHGQSLYFFVLKIFEAIEYKFLVYARFMSKYASVPVFDFTISLNMMELETEFNSESLDVSSRFDKRYFAYKSSESGDVHCGEYEKEDSFIEKVKDGNEIVWESEKDSNGKKKAKSVKVCSKGGGKRLIQVVIGSDEIEYYVFDQNKWNKSTKEEFGRIFNSEMSSVAGKALKSPKVDREQSTSIDISREGYPKFRRKSIGNFKQMRFQEFKVVQSIKDGNQTIFQELLQNCSITLIEHKGTTQFLEVNSRGNDSLYFIKLTEGPEPNWKMISQTRFLQFVKKGLEEDKEHKFITIDAKTDGELVESMPQIPRIYEDGEISNFKQNGIVFTVSLVFAVVLI